MKPLMTSKVDPEVREGGNKRARKDIEGLNETFSSPMSLEVSQHLWSLWNITISFHTHTPYIYGITIPKAQVPHHCVGILYHKLLRLVSEL